MNALALGARPKSRVTKTNIENISVVLLAVAGIMQESEIFSAFGELIDLLKYWILLLQITVLYLQFAERKLSRKNFMQILFIACVLIYTCIRTENYSFFMICLFLFTGRSITVENFVNCSLKVLTVLGGGHVLLWCINYIIPFGMTIYTHESERRIAFGFIHPNGCTLKFGWGILMFLWLNWNCMTKTKWVLLYGLSVVFYAATKSDAWLIVFIVLILAGFRKNKMIMKFVSSFSYIVFPVVGIFNILVSYYFLKNGRLTKYSMLFDILSNKRVSMGYLALSENGITLLGQKIKMTHSWDKIFNYNGYTIDSLYIYLCVCIGVVYFMIISIGFFELRKYQSYRVALIILAFSLFGLAEIRSVYLTNCFALFLLKLVIYREKEIR